MSSTTSKNSVGHIRKPAWVELEELLKSWSFKICMERDAATNDARMCDAAPKL
jgi:hypothetical protein